MNKQPLTSGLDPEQQSELGDLRPLEAALRAYEAPHPDSEQLLANLQPFMARRQESAARDWRYRVRLVQMQLSLVDGAFWWASGLLLGLGILLLAGGGTSAGLYALLSPLLAVAGTAYIFRSEARSLREFELLSAVTPLELLYTRLLLILVYNSGLALTLILLAWSQDAQIALWRLLLIWFGPMVGMTGAALYLSLRWNALAGVIVPMGAWALLLFIGWRDTVLQSAMPLAPLEAVSLVVWQSNTLLIASVAALIAGLLLIWGAGRWTAMKLA